jgi:predicted AAA+ superfamily ATPase
MPVTQVTQYKRSVELLLLREIARSKRAQFVYVRGRRRIGKSWLLQTIAESDTKIFYFSGAKDSIARSTIRSLSNAWGEFCSTSLLSSLRTDALDWRKFFDLIKHDLATIRGGPVTIILDEIQWIAKEGSGFIGALKEAWVEIEKKNLAHIIVCGSSNKFFSDHVGGEEKILRGLQTRAPIWVEPLPLRQVHNTFAPSWTEQQVALLYMMTGGIPYYLNQVDSSQGFISAINQAFFSAESIFLHEHEEILSLDFNAKGMTNVLAILQAFAVFGGTQASVRKQTKLASSTISEVFTKLLNYGLIQLTPSFEQIGSPLSERESSTYRITDFYLNFYFGVLFPLKHLISRNRAARSALFSSKVLHGAGYYIPSFTGQAFEHLIAHQITKGLASSMLIRKLALPGHDISLFHRTESRADLIIHSQAERTVHVIECKWVDAPDPRWLDTLIARPVKVNPQFSRVNAIIVGCQASGSFLKRAKSLGVLVVQLKDLFG